MVVKGVDRRNYDVITQRGSKIILRSSMYIFIDQDNYYILVCILDL